jgi:acyl-CoA synthetase (AMP-forming)/AMP-acid ligase II
VLSLEEAPAAAEVVRRLEDSVVPADLLAVILSSGTSGTQKAVMHTHGGLVRHAFNIAEFDSLPRGRRTFTSAPFFWVGGLVPGILVHIYLGGTLLMLERLDPDEAFDFIDHERPDALFGFSLVERLSTAKRFATADTSWLPEVPVAQQGSRADGSRLNSLGMSETGGVHSAPGPEARRILPDHLRGAFGRALPGMEHRIVVPDTQTELPESQEGEICVRGYSLMHGLYKRERSETFDSDGWYHTRDLGFLRDGYLFFTGRADDQIRTKGANVTPTEVEAALIGTGEVVRACVVGVPDKASGQLVGAYVVPKQPDEFDASGFLAAVATRISSYKVPRRLVVAADIPLLSSGKIDRRRIVADLINSAAVATRQQAQDER